MTVQFKYQLQCGQLIIGDSDLSFWFKVATIAEKQSILLYNYLNEKFGYLNFPLHQFLYLFDELLAFEFLFYLYLLSVMPEAKRQDAQPGETASSVLIKGPQGIPFVPIDAYKQHGIINTKICYTDKIIGALVIPAQFAAMCQPLIKEYLNSDSFLNEISEGLLAESLIDQMDKRAFIPNIHPFIIQLLTLVLCKNRLLFQLRVLSFLCSCWTLTMLYFITRKLNINKLISVSVLSIYMSLDIVQESAISNLTDNIQLASIMTLFFLWESYKYNVQNKITCSRMLFVSIPAIILVGTKYLGSTMSWLFFVLIVVYHLWQNILPDVKNFKYLKNFFGLFKLLLISMTFIPFGVLTCSYLLQDYSMIYLYDNSNYHVRSFMPIEYKKLVPTFDNYNSDEIIFKKSTVRIRHVESLGGYLSTLPNVNYMSGSFEQIAFLSQFEDSELNNWIIEPNTEAQNNKEVRSGSRIRLRNVVTGKLLRASSSRPPMSDQEYNSEVSLTGSANFSGDADETWLIDQKYVIGKAIPFSKMGLPPSENINALINTNSVFTLRNDGHGCMLLSHDTDLPDDWDSMSSFKPEFHRQELTCNTTPTKKLTYFMFESVVDQTNDTASRAPLTIHDKLKEVFKLIPSMLKTNYKFNYYIRNSQFLKGRREEDDEIDMQYNLQKFQNRVPPEKWATWRPVSLITKKPSSVYIVSIIVLVLYVLFEITNLLISWNPLSFDTPSLMVHKRLLGKISDEWMLQRMMSDDFLLECFLGWITHYYIFTRTPYQNLDIVLYLPSLLFNLLFVITIFDTLTKSNKMWFSLLPIYIALAI